MCVFQLNIFKSSCIHLLQRLGHRRPNGYCSGGYCSGDQIVNLTNWRRQTGEETKSASSSFLNHTFRLPRETKCQTTIQTHKRIMELKCGKVIIFLFQLSSYPSTHLQHSFKCTPIPAACCQWCLDLSHISAPNELIIKLGRLSSSRVFSFCRNLLAKSSWKIGGTPNR